MRKWMDAANSWVIIMVESWALRMCSFVILTRALQGGHYHCPIFLMRRLKFCERKWVTLGKQVKNDRDRTKMQMCLILQAQLLRAVPSCLQRKNEEVSATSLSDVPPRLAFRVPSSGILSLLFPGNCSPALLWSVIWAQSKALPVWTKQLASTQISGESPTSEFCGAPKLRKEKSYIFIVTNLYVKFSIVFHYRCRQQTTTVLTFTWVCPQ